MISACVYIGGRVVENRLVVEMYFIASFVIVDISVLVKSIEAV
jgi:hypothetical protein